MPTGRNATDRLTTAELLARAQLAHTNAVKTMESKVRKLERASRSYARRLYDFLLNSIWSPLISSDITKSLLNALDSKVAIIILLVGYSFGHTLLPYLSKKKK